MGSVTGSKLGDLRFGAWLRVQRPLLRLAGQDDPYIQLLLGQQDRLPFYEEIRRAGPLVRSKAQSWVTASHPLGTEILRDRTLKVCGLDGKPPGQKINEMIGWDSSFLTKDPPDHTRLRKLAAPAFTPRKIGEYRATIEKLCHELLDRVPPSGTFDLVHDFAGPLPTAVIGEMLGVSAKDHDYFHEHGMVIGALIDGVGSMSVARRVRAARDAYHRLFEEMIDARRAEPRDDLVSSLARAYDDGLLSRAELLNLCTVLAVTGFETTVNMIGNTVAALLHHPEQWEALKAKPDLAPGAVEEALRWDPPSLFATRVPHEDREFGGQSVRAGETLVVMLAAANRDPEAYEEPDRFDITRAGPDHLSFSGGSHFCIGAPLARMEGDVALRVLLERMPGLRLTAAPQRRVSSVLNGWMELPVAPGAR